MKTKHVGSFIATFLLFFNWFKMTSTFGNVVLYLPASTSENTINETAIEQIVQNVNNTSLVFVNDSDIYSQMFMSSSIQTSSSKHHISYLPSSVSSYMRKFAILHDKLLWNIHRDSCKVSLTSRFDDYFCNPDFFRAIQELTKYFHSVAAVVLTTNDKCSNAIGQKLLDTFNSTSQRDNNIGIRSLEQYVIDEKNLLENITSIVYKLKMKNIDFIINILEPDIVDILFESAARYSLTGYSIVWVTIKHGHFDSNYDLYNVPWQWLNLVSSNDDMKHWNQDTLLDVVKHTISVFQSIPLQTSRNWAENLTSYLQKRIDNIPCITTSQSVDFFARNPSISGYIQWQKAFVWNSAHNMQTFPETSFLVPTMRHAREPVTLKVVTILDPPFTMYASHLYQPQGFDDWCDQGVVCRTAVIGLPEDHPEKWKSSCCVGMIMELLLLLARDLHFVPDVYIVEDGFYGGRVKNTSEWNGLVQDVRVGKADIAVAALTATADRFQVVDFCEPYMKIELGIMVSTITDSLGFINWEFLAPLTVQLRAWILVTFFLGTILIYVLENQHLVLQRITDRTVYPRYQWREGFTYFSGLAFQRDLGGKNPQRHGARVTAVAFAFGMVIIMTTYTAVLTASKVSQATSNPFLGFKDSRVTNPTPDFKYASVSHTSMVSYFRNSKDEVHKRMYQFMLNHNVNQSLEGIESVRIGTLKAFIHEWPFLQYHASKDPLCNLKIFGEPIHQGGYAFSIPKQSPWKHLVSQSILRLKENEVIDEVYNKWFPASCSQSTNSSEYEGVEINYFGGLILVLTSCLGVSIVLLFLEHFIYRHHRRVINPIQDKVQVWRESKATGRRNAIIDVNDISYIQNLRTKGHKVTSGSGNSDDNVDNQSSSSEGDISEGEEELIRMRLGRTLPAMKMSTGEDEPTPDDSSSTDSQLNYFFATSTVTRRRQSTVGLLPLGNNNNTIKPLFTMLDVAIEEDDLTVVTEEGIDGDTTADGDLKKVTTDSSQAAAIGQSDISEDMSFENLSSIRTSSGADSKHDLGSDQTMSTALDVEEIFQTNENNPNHNGIGEAKDKNNFDQDETESSILDNTKNDIFNLHSKSRNSESTSVSLDIESDMVTTKNKLETETKSHDSELTSVSPDTESDMVTTKDKLETETKSHDSESTSVSLDVESDMVKNKIKLEAETKSHNSELTSVSPDS